MKARLSLGTRSYDIEIGKGSTQLLPQFLAKISCKQVYIISDIKLKPQRQNLKSILQKAGIKFEEISVQAGEPLKDITKIYPIYEKLFKAKADRNAVIVALGGGTIGDAAGFIAATYLRGVRWIGIPTTLLSQVDSAVGGKTGINHASGKNLIGAFHQPCLVVCDTDFLRSLKKREIISGFGETVKYGLTYDPAFYRYLESNASRFLELNSDVLIKSISKALKWKCKMVSRDEFDRTGIRETLNFGHTFGHALESLTAYRHFQHGEAVIWGMRFALRLSQIRGHLSLQDFQKLDSFLFSLSVPGIPSSIKWTDLERKMNSDKKVRDGKIHFVLLSKLGKTISDKNVKLQDLKETYEKLNGKEK